MLGGVGCVGGVGGAFEEAGCETSINFGGGCRVGEFEGQCGGKGRGGDCVEGCDDQKDSNSKAVSRSKEEKAPELKQAFRGGAFILLS